MAAFADTGKIEPFVCLNVLRLFMLYLSHAARLTVLAWLI